eukprot:scaffold2219_cov177-Amphora_coffeaeformis.AAC.9
MIFQVLGRIGVYNSQARILKHRCRRLVKVRFTNLDDHFVNVYHDDFFHARVTTDFTQDKTVTAAYNQNPAWIWMRTKRKMSHHFVIGEFITFSQLDDSVENQNSAVLCRLENEDFLASENFCPGQNVSISVNHPFLIVGGIFDNLDVDVLDLTSLLGMADMDQSSPILDY